MAEHIDKEIEAIKAVLHALEPLPAEIRVSVLGYVLQRLQIVLAPSTQVSTGRLIGCDCGGSRNWGRPAAITRSHKSPEGTEEAPLRERDGSTSCVFLGQHSTGGRAQK